VDNPVDAELEWPPAYEHASRYDRHKITNTRPYTTNEETYSCLTTNTSVTVFKNIIYFTEITAATIDY